MQYYMSFNARIYPSYNVDTFADRATHNDFAYPHALLFRTIIYSLPTLHSKRPNIQYNALLIFVSGRENANSFIMLNRY